jgi:predicted amidohydrolase
MEGDMARTLGIAGIQMEVRDGEDHQKKMARLVKKACIYFPWVDIILFSELCAFGGNPSSAESIPGPVTDGFCNLAAKHGKWLVPGSLYEKDGDEIYNTAVAISPTGRIKAKYRKLFPWRPLETNARGSDFSVFDIPDYGRFGLAICYDQWFPEVIRTLAWMGAEVILHPTMTTTSDRVLELVLSQANAIVNQLYFLSVNGVRDGGTGQSVFIDPDGRILQTAGESETILTEVLDLDRVTRARECGTIGLCQTLKELRDFPYEFPIYKEGINTGEVFRRMSRNYNHKKID